MDLLESAISYLGINEKLGTHKQIIDTYNQILPLPRGYKMKYSDAWCMAFVSACAKLSGMPKRFPYECSCAKAIEKLKEQGMWIENDEYYPDKNDLIFYHWGEDRTKDCTAIPNHVGIVGYVQDGCIRVLEGNFNDRVAWRDIPLNYKYIRGFGNTSMLWKKSIDTTLIAQQVISGLWGNNPERKEALIKSGYDYSVIQSEVNRILESENSVENEYELKAIALEVIRGEWGNSPDRKTKLINNGYDYEAVMEIVNNYYKGGKK